MDTTSPPARDSGRSIGLRNWRVRSKLIAVLQAFEDGRRLAELGRQVMVLVHELQAERDFSGAYTVSGNGESARSSSLTRRAIAAEYSRNIDQRLDVNADIAGPGGDEDLPQAVRFFNDLSRAKEVTGFVGADSLGYLSLEALTETVAGPRQGPGGLCTACFTGTHPIPTHAAAGPDLRPSATTQPPTLPLPDPEPEVTR
jgi:hypothetical protein